MINMLCKGFTVLSIMLGSLCSFLWSISSRCSKAVSSTEPAFFTTLFFVLLTVMLLPQQMAAKGMQVIRFVYI